jgi:hypothetical protein
VAAGSVAEPELSALFACHYCRRQFYSSHVLGGHQNAHKLVRHRANAEQLVLAHHAHASFLCAFMQQCSCCSAGVGVDVRAERPASTGGGGRLRVAVD